MVDYKFVFETRGDAYDTLRDMRDVLNKKGLVTVADLATLVGCVPNCTDKDYCWATLPRIEVLRDRHGYMLDLPKPMKITARMEEEKEEKPKVQYVSYKDFYNNKNWRGTASRPQITNVMFHPPATIVFWSDKTKTVVKCDERDVFDAEKGLAMAITKKMLGNNYEYYEIFEKWSSPYCAKEKSENTTPVRSFDSECLRFETEIVFDTWSECRTLIEYLRNKVERYGVTTVGDLYRYAGSNPPKNCEIYGWFMEDIDALWFKKQTPEGYMLKIAAPKPIV